MIYSKYTENLPYTKYEVILIKDQTPPQDGTGPALILPNI